MTVTEFASHFNCNRKTALAICHDQILSIEFGCHIVNGAWIFECAPESDKWYKTSRVSQMMQKSQRHVRRWCRSGVIQAKIVGKKYRIPQREVLKLIELRD